VRGERSGPDCATGEDLSELRVSVSLANEIYRRVFAQGMAGDYPLTMTNHDGTAAEVLYDASVYRDAGGNVLGVFAAARDVTKQVHAQRDTADRQGRQQERLVEPERFQRLTVGCGLKNDRAGEGDRDAQKGTFLAKEATAPPRVHGAGAVWSLCCMAVVWVAWAP